MNVCEYCGKNARESFHGHWYCKRHYLQMYRHGKILKRTIYDPNDYEILDDHAEIILRDKHGDEIGRALIDLEDVERCKQYKWYRRIGTGNTNYCMASISNGTKSGGKKIFLHRFIMDYWTNEKEIDHIDMNGLNNRKENLRIVTHSKNMSNNKNTGVKQVPSGNWQAAVCRNYKTIYIGTFHTKEKAIEARKTFIENLN